MAKLYAELTSDKGGRVASKGGDENVTVSFYFGNLKIYEINMNEYGQLTARLQFGTDKGFTTSLLWEQYQMHNELKRRK